MEASEVRVSGRLNVAQRMFLSLWERLGEGAQHRAGIEISFDSIARLESGSPIDVVQSVGVIVGRGLLVARPQAYESERRRRAR